jgi:hypothetical protein
MNDINWYDTYGPWRRSWKLRLGFPNPRSRWFWRSWYDWLIDHDYGQFSFSMGRWESGTCYCRSGRRGHIHLIFFGFCLHFWCCRDRGPLPCLCDLSLWDAFPDEYPDEVFEHGGSERVKRLIEAHQKRLGNR